MIRGYPKFDGLAVGEGTFSFLGATIHLEAKAAFVSAKTGDTHGWTKNTQWSPQVMEKLRELRTLMEIDLGRLHLTDGGEMPATAATSGPSFGSDGGGLGEHFRDTTPQI